MYIGLYGFVGMFAQYVAVPFLSGKLKLHDTTIGQSSPVLDEYFLPFVHFWEGTKYGIESAMSHKMLNFQKLE